MNLSKEQAKRILNEGFVFVDYEVCESPFSVNSTGYDLKVVYGLKTDAIDKEAQELWFAEDDWVEALGKLDICQPFDIEMYDGEMCEKWLIWFKYHITDLDVERVALHLIGKQIECERLNNPALVVQNFLSNKKLAMLREHQQNVKIAEMLTNFDHDFDYYLGGEGKAWEEKHAIYTRLYNLLNHVGFKNRNRIEKMVSDGVREYLPRWFAKFFNQELATA